MKTKVSPNAENYIDGKLHPYKYKTMGTKQKLSKKSLTHAMIWSFHALTCVSLTRAVTKEPALGGGQGQLPCEKGVAELPSER